MASDAGGQWRRTLPEFAFVTSTEAANMFEGTGGVLRAGESIECGGHDHGKRDAARPSAGIPAICRQQPFVVGIHPRTWAKQALAFRQ
jgi:hypothetical protein